MSTTTAQTETTKRPLPAGWRWGKLGEVCRVVGGSTPSSHIQDYWNGEIVWITPKDLGQLDSPIITSSERKITKEGYENCGTEMVPAGAVVLSSRAPIGHLGIAGVPLCTNQGCKSFVPSAQIDSEFLYYSLKISVPKLQALGSGATFTEVSKTDLENFSIPLPPLDEQRRIAAMLREQMAAVERARRAAEEQLEAAKALPAAYLRQAFPRPDQPLPPGWRWVKLGEVCRQDRTIIEPGSSLAESLPYLSLEHVESNTGRILKQPNGEIEDEGKSTTFYFDSRHVLYGKLRPYLNKVALPDFAGRCTTEMIPLLPADQTDREFLCWVLRRQETVDAAMRGKTGSRMPRADMDELMNFSIPLPPLSEQRRIAAILRKQMAAAERARKVLEEQLEAINRLPAAILRKAFNGEL